MKLNFNYWRVKFRPFKWDDLYNVQALINVIAQDENIPYHYSLEWLHFVLNQADVHATQTCFVAALDNDRLVGFSRYEVNDDPQCWKVWAGVHPEFNEIGVGRWLIALNDFNALVHRPEQTPLMVRRQSSPQNKSTAALLKHAGYHQIESDDDTVLRWQKTLR